MDGAKRLRRERPDVGRLRARRVARAVAASPAIMTFVIGPDGDRPREGPGHGDRRGRPADSVYDPDASWAAVGRFARTSDGDADGGSGRARHAPAPPSCAGGVTFSVFQQTCDTRSSCSCFDDRRGDLAGPRDSARRRHAPHVSLPARIRRRAARGPDLRVPRARTVRARARACASTARSCCSIRTAAPSRVPRRLRSRRPRAAGRQRRRPR